MSRHDLPTAQAADRHGQSLVLWVFVVVTMAGAGCQRAPAPHTLADAKAAFAQGDFRTAEQYALEVPRDHPDRDAALALAGEAAAKDRRVNDAVEHYQALAKRQRQAGSTPLGLFYAAEADRDAGRLANAETSYRQFLQFAPQHVLTNERLAFLTSVSGRRWDSVPYYWTLVKSGKAEMTELILFGDLDRPIEQRPYLEACAQQAPKMRSSGWDWPRILFGKVRPSMRCGNCRPLSIPTRM